jgi:glycosyltransferase involved in cell wall biosynthesis
MSIISSSVACVSVLIPAYNEETTIESVLLRVLDQAVVKEIIVIDDGSTDKTVENAQKVIDSRIRIIRQGTNHGKTAAIARGVKAASGAVIIIQDADFEYDPSEIPLVVGPILEGYADVVYGSRFLVRRAARVVYFYHYVANRFLTLCSNFLTNLNLTDIETGYKAFRAEVLKGMPFKSSGFGMEVEITASIAQLPLRIYEVPISYYGRTYDEGKKIGLRDGIAAIGYIAWFNGLERYSSERRAFRASVRRLIESRVEATRLEGCEPPSGRASS